MQRGRSAGTQKKSMMQMKREEEYEKRKELEHQQLFINRLIDDKANILS